LLAQSNPILDLTFLFYPKQGCLVLALPHLNSFVFQIKYLNQPSAQSLHFAHEWLREYYYLLRESQQRFAEVVLRPAFRLPRGLARLRAIVVNWLDWTKVANLPGGCVINAAAAEFDDQPGPLRDEVRNSLLALRRTLVDTVAKAVAAGELRSVLEIST